MNPPLTSYVNRCLMSADPPPPDLAAEATRYWRAAVDHRPVPAAAHWAHTPRTGSVAGGQPPSRAELIRWWQHTRAEAVATSTLYAAECRRADTTPTHRHLDILTDDASLHGSETDRRLTVLGFDLLLDAVVDNAATVVPDFRQSPRAMFYDAQDWLHAHAREAASCLGVGDAAAPGLTRVAVEALWQTYHRLISGEPLPDTAGPGESTETPHVRDQIVTKMLAAVGLLEQHAQALQVPCYRLACNTDHFATLIEQAAREAMFLPMLPGR